MMNPQETTHHSEYKDWNCHRCTFKNPSNYGNCIQCYTSRRMGEPIGFHCPTADYEGGGVANASPMWACTSCTFENEDYRSVCEMCCSERPSPTILTPEKVDAKTAEEEPELAVIQIKTNIDIHKKGNGTPHFYQKHPEHEKVIDEYVKSKYALDNTQNFFQDAKAQLERCNRVGSTSSPYEKDQALKMARYYEKELARTQKEFSEAKMNKYRMSFVENGLLQ